MTTTQTQPTKATWLVHGEPQSFTFLGRKPEASAIGRQVRSVTKIKNTLHLLDANGIEVGTMGVTAKWWLAPALDDITQPSEAEVMADYDHQMAEAQVEDDLAKLVGQLEDEAGIKPTRATWKGHGNPQAFIWLGWAAKPITSEDEASEVTKVTSDRQGLTYFGPEGNQVARLGNATKFWAMVPEQAQPESDLDKALSGKPVKAGTDKVASAERQAAKAAAAKAAAARTAKLDEAAQGRLAKLPEDKRAALLALVPEGYQVIWPKGAWATLKLVSGPEDAPTWMILCTAHGTTKALAGSKAAEAEGKAIARAAWCRKCKTAQAKAQAAADLKAAASDATAEHDSAQASQ